MSSGSGSRTGPDGGDGAARAPGVGGRFLPIHGDVAPAALEVVEALQPDDVSPESPADAVLWHLHRLDVIDEHHGPLPAPARHEAVTEGTSGEYDGQSVIERWTDDGTGYRSVPDQPADLGAQAEMPGLVARGCRGERLPPVTRLREPSALVRDDICPRLFPFLQRPLQPSSGWPRSCSPRCPYPCPGTCSRVPPAWRNW